VAEGKASNSRIHKDCDPTHELATEMDEIYRNPSSIGVCLLASPLKG